MATLACQSAWLFLAGAAAAALLLASGAAAQDCASENFQSGRSFLKCATLPVLSASLHWTYHPENGTADVAYRALSDTGGWVAWGINTEGTQMIGSSVFIASLQGGGGGGGGGVSVLTTVLESTSPSLTNEMLRFNVPVQPFAEYTDGAYTIYSTVALPGNATRQNTVWQAGPMNGGTISPHPRSSQNLQSFQSMDFANGSNSISGMRHPNLFMLVLLVAALALL